jgi:hypothetical protein
MKKLLLFVSLFLLFSNCQQNNPTPTSSTNVDLYYEITISNNTIEGYYNFSGWSGMVINPTSSSGIVNGTFTTPTSSRVNFDSGVHLNNNLVFYPTDPNSIGCIDIELKSYVDGSLHETVNIQLGKTSVSPIINCSVHGNTYNYDSYWP